MFLMWSCSFFMSVGLVRGSLWRKLSLGIFVLRAQFSVSAVPFGPGIDIWRSCRFIGALMRSSLLAASWRLGRFVPCSSGANQLQASSYWVGEVWSWSYF